MCLPLEGRRLHYLSILKIKSFNATGKTKKRLLNIGDETLQNTRGGEQYDVWIQCFGCRVMGPKYHAAQANISASSNDSYMILNTFPHQHFALRKRIEI
jgi:hypothetical protein